MPAEALLDGEEGEVADTGMMLVEVVDAVEEGASVELEPVEVELDVPDLVLTMFPFPSKTVPRPSLQQLGSSSQQKLSSSHTATRGRNPVPVAVNA